MTWAAVGTAAVSVVGSVASSQLGKQKAPKGAQPAQIDVGEESLKAINFNTENFDKIQSLVNKTNRSDQDSAIKLMEQVLPGFSSVSQQYMRLVQSDLEAEQSGRLPENLKQEIFRTAAGNNLSTGAQGQAGDFNVNRNLGLGALDYQNMLRQRSLQTLSQITGLSPRINPMSTRAMMLTPSQAIQGQQFKEQSRYHAQQSQANAEAAASNTNAGINAEAIQGLTGAAGGFINAKWGTKTPQKDPNGGIL